MMYNMRFGFGPLGGFGSVGLFEIMFGVVFVLILGVFVMVIVKGIGQWNKNNHSPSLIVPATIVTKRTNVSHHRHGGTNDIHHHTSTTDYVTFQGTRYIGFERT